MNNPIYFSNIRHHSRDGRCAFSLVELLIVIAIIGILASILFPAFGLVMELAKQTEARERIRQVAMSYNMLKATDDRFVTVPKNSVNDMHDWAAYLAAKGGVNIAEVYFINSDPLVAAAESLPRVIVVPNPNGEDSVHPKWPSAPISYEAAAGISPTAPSSMTPLIWTRGLGTDGNWSKEDSPWEGKGGHVAYTDGHVRWYKTLDNPDGGELVDPYSYDNTASISNAIGNAKIVK